jgi:rhodanese-related sulfurtransferase
MPMVEKFLGSGGDYVLIDVRSKEEFESGHIRDAENWQYDEIMSIKSLNDIPERFRGKSLYLVCNSGIRSALAAQSLRKNFSVDAFNVAGGLEACLAYDMPCG